MKVTEGTLVGGRVRYRQFKAGHRSGFEPVLLAAAVPAKAGERVLEAGTGAGAGLLCLAARVKGVAGMGLEIDPALAALASENFKINGFDGVSALVADAEAPPAVTVDHVFANPPWHDPAGTKSPDGKRALAHHAQAGLVGRWVAALGGRLAAGGSFTLILPAARLVEGLAALGEMHGEVTLFPLWPRAGTAAKIFVARARRGSKAPAKLLPGLVLHDEAGITAAAQAVLRDGAALEF